MWPLSKFLHSSNHGDPILHEGLEDLKKGLIATPLPAKSTFLDDPLRVLRAIRFGTFKHPVIDLKLFL
jgi:hypothetical protein